MDAENKRKLKDSPEIDEENNRFKNIVSSSGNSENSFNNVGEINI